MLTLTRSLTPNEHKAAITTDTLIRKAAPGLQPAHVALWREQPILARDRRTKDPWLLTPLEHDPYRTQDGGYPLPAEVRKDLELLAKVEIPFHCIAVAHELQESPAVTRLLEKPGPAGVILTPKQAAQVLGKLPAPVELREKTRSVDATVTRALSLLGKGAATAAAVAAAPFAMLDPIIFGVRLLTDPSPSSAKREAIALYYPLVAWEW